MQEIGSDTWRMMFLLLCFLEDEVIHCSNSQRNLTSFWGYKIQTSFFQVQKRNCVHPLVGFSCLGASHKQQYGVKNWEKIWTFVFMFKSTFFSNQTLNKEDLAKFLLEKKITFLPKQILYAWYSIEICSRVVEKNK